MIKKKEEKTRVDKFFDYINNHKKISLIVISSITIVSIVSVLKSAGDGYYFIKDIWSYVSSEKLLSQEEVDDWARNQKPKEDIITNEIDDKVKKTTSKISLVYNTFLQSLFKTTRAYQKSDSSNVYIQISKLPENFFNENIKDYRGCVTFSQNAGWSISYKDQLRNNKVIQVIEVHFMNCDGTSKGGTGIGYVQIFFDTKNNLVDISSSGVGQIAIKDINEKFTIEDFLKVCPNITKSMLEYQLQHL